MISLLLHKTKAEPRLSVISMISSKCNMVSIPNKVKMVII